MDKKTNQKIENFRHMHQTHFMKTISKDFLEVDGLRSRGFQLLLHELQQRCGQNFGKKCNYICWIKQEIVDGWECGQSVAWTWLQGISELRTKYLLFSNWVQGPYQEIQIQGFSYSPSLRGLFGKPRACISWYGTNTQLVNSLLNDPF